MANEKKGVSFSIILSILVLKKKHRNYQYFNKKKKKETSETLWERLRSAYSKATRSGLLRAVAQAAATKLLLQQCRPDKDDVLSRTEQSPSFLKFLFQLLKQRNTHKEGVAAISSSPLYYLLSFLATKFWTALILVLPVTNPDNNK